MPEVFVSTDIEADGPIPGPHSMLMLGAFLPSFRPERLRRLRLRGIRSLYGGEPTEGGHVIDAYASNESSPLRPSPSRRNSSSVLGSPDLASPS